MSKPCSDIGERAQGSWIEDAAHNTAIGVATDDQINHAKDAHGVFDGGGDSAQGVWVMRHDVADDPTDEEFPRLGLREEAGIDAGIGAGDKESFRALAEGEFFEQIAMLGVNVLLKVLEAAQDFLGRHVPRYFALIIGVQNSNLPSESESRIL